MPLDLFLLDTWLLRSFFFFFFSPSDCPFFLSVGDARWCWLLGVGVPGVVSWVLACGVLCAGVLGVGVSML
jgi:hypothetical protein